MVTTDGAFAPALFFRSATAANTITVDDSGVTAQDSFAVLANGGTDTLNVVNNATLTGDRLVYAGDCLPANCGGIPRPSVLTLSATTNSQLFGHADVSSISTLTLNLNSNARWTLRPSAAGLLASSVSVLNLDSTIAFDNLNDASKFQTLTVGAGVTGTTAVYNAGANARIAMNVRLDTGGLGTLTTDRLLINGDVTGTTLIDVKEVAGSPGGLTGTTASDGISIVQASGVATQNAFALPGGYVTMGGQPYRYALVAFGPNSSNGAADVSDQLVSGNNHWDWRLQSEFLAPPPPPPLPPPPPPPPPLILAPVPQVANYLVAPNALLQAGLLDIGSLHRRLGETRQIVDLPRQERMRRAFFLRTYGGDYDYRSNRSLLQYGYGADVRHTAAQIGGIVHSMQTTQNSVNLGLAASHGNLAFTPRHVADTHKTKLDTWSISPTLTWQHGSGIYVDTVLSAGRFKGDVSTHLRGKTATLKGQSAVASVETGLPLTMSGLTVEPQMQIVYQHLKFDPTRDVDNFTVALGSVKQWTLRAGGEVRTSLATVAGNPISLYGKLHLAQTLDNGKTVWLGDDFTLGKSGATLDGGLGLDAVWLGGRMSLYGELTRQQRVSRAGHEGWVANLGVKVRF